MLVAVFGVFLLINRYTGGFMEGVLSYVLPIPIAAYTVRYGRRQAVIVFVCMCLFRNPGAEPGPEKGAPSSTYP